MNLTFRQLMTFREVIRSGSISQAARTLGRTQPAVSAMIAGLEAELGFALFLREQGKLQPTPEARFLLEECDAVLGRLERTKQVLAGVSELQTGTLKIACHPAAAGFFMPGVLTEFLADKPQVDVSLMMRSSTVIEDLVASQQFDIGFAETPGPRASIRQQDFDLECVCILPVGDPLAATRVLTPADLDGKPMAVLFEEHPTAIQTRAAFQAAGCRLNKRLELRTFLPGLQFVATGFCYMVCDMITAYSYLVQRKVIGDLAIRRFRPRISSGISLLTPGYLTHTVLAQGFSTHLVAAIGTMQDEVERALDAAPDHNFV